MEFRVFAKQGKDIHALVEIGEPKVSMSVGVAASFTFVLYPNNEMYNRLTQLTTYVDVMRDSEYIFRGRVVAISPKNNNDGSFWQEVTCESALAYLNDSMLVWEKVNQPPRDFFRKLINNHNSQVDSERQLKIGNVSVTNSTNNLYCYVEDGLTTLAEITTDLIQNEDLGGELWIRYESDGTYIDWIRDSKTKGSQDIRLAKNLLELSTSPDISTVATVLYPFGSVQSDVNTDDKAKDVSTPHLTISSVNNGKPYLIDDELFKKYGWLAKTQTWDNVTDANNLLSKAKAYFDKLKKIKVSYTLQAVDLYPLGVVDKPFELGKYYHVVNPAIGTEEWLRIVGIVIDMARPLESTYTIGDQVKRLVDYDLEALGAREDIKRLSEQNRVGRIEITKLKAENEGLRQANDSLRHDLQVIAGSGGAAPSGQTQPINGDWSGVIRNAAKVMQVNDLTDSDVKRILDLINNESGGDQTVTQTVWDVNMANGNPAQGLLQYIPSTFRSYSLEGHTSILSGYDQLLAFFNNKNWRSDIHIPGWGPTGSRRYDKIPVITPTYTDGAARLRSEARKYLGVKYVYGGGRPIGSANPYSGLDCSSFIAWVFHDLGINIPAQTVSMEPYFTTVSKAQPGDVGFYGGHGNSYHVCLFLDSQTIIYAPTEGEVVKEKPVSYYPPNWIGRNANMAELVSK